MKLITVNMLSYKVYYTTATVKHVPQYWHNNIVHRTILLHHHHHHCTIHNLVSI